MCSTSWQNGDDKFTFQSSPPRAFATVLHLRVSRPYELQTLQYAHFLSAGGITTQLFSYLCFRISYREIYE